MIRIRFKGGWENVCIGHYDRHFQMEADEFCRANNLKTQPEKMAWIKQRIGNIGNPSRQGDHWQRVMATQGLPDISYRYAQMVIGKREQIERQPGQDDEEREAA